VANDQELDELAEIPPEQLSDALAKDLARRWDPERLLKLVAARAGQGEQLDATLRSRYEQKLGVDLGHVRIYSGEFAEEFNKRRNADAVTIGGTGMILMGGTTDRSPMTQAGQALLAHELTHVAQAERGIFRAGRGVDMDLATEQHEHEAEAAEHSEMTPGGPAAAQLQHQHAADTAKQLLDEEVVTRVIEMLGESMRVLIARGGDEMRRP